MVAGDPRAYLINLRDVRSKTVRYDGSAWLSFMQAFMDCLDPHSSFDLRGLQGKILDLRRDGLRVTDGLEAWRRVWPWGLIPEPQRELMARFWFFFESPWSYNSEPDVISIPGDDGGHPGMFAIRWTNVHGEVESYDTTTTDPDEEESYFFTFDVWGEFSDPPMSSVIEDTCGPNLADYLLWNVLYGFDIPQSPGMDLVVTGSRVAPENIPLDAFIDDYRSWVKQRIPDPRTSVINRKSL